MEKSAVEELILKLKSTSFSDKNERVIIGALDDLTGLMRSDLFRNALNTEHWIVIGELSENASRILVKEKKSDEDYEFLISLLRFLRNSCAGCCENEKNLIKTLSACNFAKDTVLQFLNVNSSKDLLILKISIQLFGNILLCDRNTVDLVWDLFHKRHLFRKLFAQEDKTVKEYTMMVLYHCLNEENSKSICTSTDDPENYLHILIKLYIENELLWIPEVMKYLLEQDVLFSSYKSLDSFQRCVLPEAFDMHLEENKSDKILTGSMNKLTDIFEKDVSDIMHSFLTPYEIMKILSILCKASVTDSYMPILQSKKELLKACVVSLKVIHLLGSQNKSSFSKEPESSYHGFKSQLIQLIGNLSYKCKENQDLVRSLDGIPLILDCCRLDENNPFIREWCILAVRNLLENNLDNQAIVAGISSNGEMVQSEFLSDLGLVAQNEEGQIRIRPKPKNLESKDKQS